MGIRVHLPQGDHISLRHFSKRTKLAFSAFTKIVTMINHEELHDLAEMLSQIVRAESCLFWNRVLIPRFGSF